MEKENRHTLIEARRQLNKNITESSNNTRFQEILAGGGAKLWDYYGKRGREARAYEVDFLPFLREYGVSTFAEWIEKRSRELGRKLQVMDVMGLGDFIEDQTSIDHMFAVTLTNPDDIETVTERSVHNTHYIFGNIYTQDTKERVRKEMDKHGVVDIDLIVVRPLLPFMEDTFKNPSADTVNEGDMREAHWAFYYRQLQRLYPFLSEEEGLLLAQLPIRQATGEMQAVLDDYSDIGRRLPVLKGMLSKHNIDCDVSLGYGHSQRLSTVKLVRHKGSADELPSLNQSKIDWDLLYQQSRNQAKNK